MSYAELLASKRDVSAAAALVERAAEATGRRDPQILGILATLQHQAGNATASRATVAEALKIAEQTGDRRLVERLRAMRGPDPD
jgi:hypothetical protein